MTNSTTTITLDLQEETKKLHYLVKLTWIISPFYMVISLVGNLTLIIATTKLGKIWKKPINILILNNSVCNVLITLILFPIYVATLSVEGGEWSRHYKFCYISFFLFYWISAVLHLNLVLAVLNQLRIIVRTINQKTMNEKTGKIVMTCVWVIPFLLCIGAVLSHQGDFHCMIGWIEYHNTELNTKATIISTSVIVIIPMLAKLILILIYFIFLVILGRIKNDEAILNSLLYARRIEEKKATVRTMFSILILFFFTQTPVHVQQILVRLQSMYPSETIVTYIVNLIAFSHTWLSPLLVYMLFPKYGNYYRHRFFHKNKGRI